MDTEFKIEIPAALRNYNGGKRGAGTYQALINQMPRHDWYVEPFLGGGGVMGHKRPALKSWGYDINRHVVKLWEDANPQAIAAQRLSLGDGDSVFWLKVDRSFFDRPGTLIYCDPPYLAETRRDPDSPLYLFEMMGIDEHRQLLQALLQYQEARIMISCYDHPLYAEMLAGWHKWQYWNTTRKGRALETVYQNYTMQGRLLHDVRYAGADYRKREQIKRKAARWRKNFEAQTPEQRQAILEALGAVTATPAAIHRSGEDSGTKQPWDLPASMAMRPGDPAENSGGIASPKIAVLARTTANSDGVRTAAYGDGVLTAANGDDRSTGDPPTPPVAVLQP